MLEIILCSLVTILPDYLYRRYRQGKRFGHEITLYSVWFELRFGIISCLMLTVALITMIFYYHPSTNSATLYYRTVPIMSEVTGRVAAVHIDISASVKKGEVLFRLDSAKQEAALLTAKRKIAEVDAAMLSAPPTFSRRKARSSRPRATFSRRPMSWRSSARRYGIRSVRGPAGECRRPSHSRARPAPCGCAGRRRTRRPLAAGRFS